MHIVFAIPTFNRVEQLKKCVESILSQRVNEHDSMSLVISNSASTDGTSAYLDELVARENNVTCYNKKSKGQFENFKFLSRLIPKSADWVWLMGDDDFLTSSDCLNAVRSSISEHKDPDLAFVHACQARRSKNNGSIFEGTVNQLCQEFGYHEMLGWFSSLVVKRDIFCLVLEKSHRKINKKEGATTDIGSCYSAYTHSSYLYRYLHDKKGLFIDLPLVEPQDIQQTAESVQRWAEQRVLERYFYVVDDMIELRNDGCMPLENNTEFFRYLNMSLWDRYVAFLLTQLLDQSVSFESKKENTFIKAQEMHWNRIKYIADMLSDKTVSKQLLIRAQHGVELADLYFRTKGKSETVIATIQRHIALCGIKIYPFQVAI